MQIVINEQLKDAIEWTCKYANEYKVDIDIHIDADGEVSVSICPTYRDRDTADTPQTEEKHAICNGCVYCDLPNAFHPCASCVDFSKYVGEESGDTPQTDCGWK